MVDVAPPELGTIAWCSINIRLLRSSEPKDSFSEFASSIYLFEGALAREPFSAALCDRIVFRLAIVFRRPPV